MLRKGAIQLNKKTLIADIIFITYFLVVFLMNISLENGLLRNFINAFFSGIIGLSLLFSNWKRNIRMFLLTIPFLICFFISFLFNNNADLFEFLWIIAYFSISLFLFNGDVSSKAAGFTFYTIACAFSIFMLFKINPNEVLYSSSRNGISSILLLQLVLYEYIKYEKNKKIDVFAIIVHFILCCWSMGRAGIATALLLLIFGISFSLWRLKDNKKRSVRLFIGIIVTVVLFFTFFDQIVTLLDNIIARFARTDINSSRSLIWKEYNALAFGDFGSFLFGAKFSEGELLSNYQNPHNSFLMMHARFGLVPTIILFFVLIYWLYINVQKNNLVNIILTFIVGIRIFLDWCAFPGSYDILFWYACLRSVDDLINNKASSTKESHIFSIRRDENYV